MVRKIAAALQVVGLVAVTVAAFMVAVPLGLTVAGAGLVAVGVAVERDGR